MRVCLAQINAAEREKKDRFAGRESDIIFVDLWRTIAFSKTELENRSLLPAGNDRGVARELRLSKMIQWRLSGNVILAPRRRIFAPIYFSRPHKNKLHRVRDCVAIGSRLGRCQDPEKGEAGFLERLKIARAFSRK